VRHQGAAEVEARRAVRCGRSGVEVLEDVGVEKLASIWYSTPNQITDPPGVMPPATTAESAKLRLGVVWAEAAPAISRNARSGRSSNDSGRPRLIRICSSLTDETFVRQE
jgi:hypothetical protein